MAESEGPLVHSAAYYERLYALEGGHWWFRGMRAIAAALLASHYAGRRGLTVLDAGCGTGIVLSQLRRMMPAGGALGGGTPVPALPLCQARGHRPLGAAPGGER